MKNEDFKIYLVFDGCFPNTLQVVSNNLFELYRNRNIENNFSIIYLDNLNISEEEFRKKITDALNQSSPNNLELDRFIQKTQYKKFAHTFFDYLTLKLEIEGLEESYMENCTRYFLFLDNMNNSQNYIDYLYASQVVTFSTNNKFISADKNIIKTRSSIIKSICLKDALLY